MLRSLIAAGAVLLALSSVAHARAKPGGFHPECNRTMPCIGAPMPWEASPRATRKARAYAKAEWGSPIVPPETARSYVNALPAPLASKAAEIVRNCNARLGNNARHSTFVRGTKRVSLHKSNQAIDIMGPPACIYAHLVGWPGGYSTDSRIGHVHVSYTYPGGKEWGARFAHGRHKKHRRHRR